MSGNGIDLGQIAAMLQSLIQSQADMRLELRGEIRGEVQNSRTELKGEIQQLRQEMRRGLEEQAHATAELRREVAMYHGSVMGHGIMITELDARLRRVEEHLKLSPAA